MRRFPWLTAEDMTVLRALPADAARVFENALHREADEEKAFRAEVALAGLGDSLERLAAPELARWTRGAGGGRHHRPPGHGPDA